MSQTLNSWKENFKAWVEIIQSNSIPSRTITNPAIIRSVLANSQGAVLDLGCGEGWLCRALEQAGFEAFGIDGTLGLIEVAKQLGNESRFACLSFEEIIAWSEKRFSSQILDQFTLKQFDALIFNFCLYGDVNTKALLLAVKSLLKKDGKLFIQTIHPMAMFSSGLYYKSQWMEDAWKGLPGNFKNGHRWYFRTLQDWSILFKQTGYLLQEMIEPQEEESPQPSSIIFVLRN